MTIMRKTARRAYVSATATALAALALAAPAARAASFATIYSVGSTSGYLGSAVIASNGVVYGSTYYAPSGAWGQVFSLTNPGAPPWTQANLSSLPGSTSAGDNLAAGQLYADTAGNLYGATPGAGNSTTACKMAGFSGCGLAFKLAPPATAGGSWTRTTLYTFKGGSDAQTPMGGFIADTAGNLYGVSRNGGGATACNAGCGTVFRLSPPTGTATAWTETVLYAFQGGTDGSSPNPRLLLIGNTLFGTTRAGGNTVNTCGTIATGQQATCGTVFSLTPPASGTGAWSESVLYRFKNLTDGSAPQSGVVADSTGNLYGAAMQNGNSADKTLNCKSVGLSGCGTIFKLTKPTTAGTTWKLVPLYIFPNTGTAEGPLGVLRDSIGNLYGAAAFTPSGHTCSGLSFYCGEVFKLTKPNATHPTWTYSALHTFTTGAEPGAGLAVDTAGVLYGITTYGTNTVFSVSASGYKP